MPRSCVAPIWMPPESFRPPKKWRLSWRTRAPDKRAKVVERLMERDEFVDYWAYKWSDLLLVSTRRLNSTAMWAFYDWIRDSVRTNKPWDQFAKEIFLSSGSTRQNGALNYFVLHKDPIDLSENATQAFLGQRIMCARCHNHPAREVDSDAVLPDGQPVRPGGREERRDGRREYHLRQNLGRRAASPPCARAASHAARWAEHRDRFAGRPPGRVPPTGSPARRTRCSRGP